jgi:hypothetical protein
MFKQHSFMGHFAVVACIAYSIIPFAANAQQMPSESNESAPESLTFDEILVLDGQSYAKIYGVGLEEAMRRILAMNDTTESVETLSSEFAGKTGGQYFTHGSDFGLKMRLTGPEKRANRRLSGSQTVKQQRQAARKAEKLRAGDAGKAARMAARRKALDILDSQVALAETVSDQPIELTVQFLADAPADRDAVVQAVSAQMPEIQSRIPSVDAVAYDERRGSVVVSVVGSSGSVVPAVQEAIAAMFPVPVAYQYVSKRLGVAAAAGGTPNYTLPGSPWCTNAFVGYDSANKPGVFSASHCRWSGASSIGMNYKDTNGTTTQLGVDPNLSAWTTHGDMLFLTLGAGLLPSSQFFADKGTAARTLTGRRTLSTTSVKSGTTAGSMICFYGRTTGPVSGQSCGEVVAKGVVLSLNASEPMMAAGSGTSYYVAVQGPSATMKCQGGDSGAPWFALSIAWGTMSRCAENWVGSDSYAYYTSMDAAYAKGYRLSY